MEESERERRREMHRERETEKERERREGGRETVSLPFHMSMQMDSETGLTLEFTLHCAWED